ncbi:hypothetical protein ACW17M_04045 [Vreelandella sp. 2A-K22]
MPPLLPEYLNQPVQIVVQSQQTDWWALVAAGLFTLVGAALGAWYGGRSAYKNTVKAQIDAVKRQKLEEALSIVYQLEQPLSSLTRNMPLHQYFGDEGLEKSINIARQVNYGDAERLEGLMQVYDKSLFLQSERLCISINVMRSGFSIAEALGEDPEKLLDSVQACEANLLSLKKDLISKLEL